MISNDAIRIVIPKESPLVSVIIPSLDGYRGGNVPRLLDDLRRQTLQDFEVIIVKGIRPNGRARNEGVKRAQGEILICIDDDVRLGHERVIENLIRPFSTDKTIGLTGASQLIPEDASWFQKKEAREIPRSFFPVVAEITETDMVSHMCLAIPTRLYKNIGWENEKLISGTDPDLKYRVRQVGYKVVVVPQTWAYHPLPETMIKLIRMGYQKGKDSALVRRQYPGLIYETADDGWTTNFKPQRPLVYRVVRSLTRLLWIGLSLKFIRLVFHISYILGYIQGTFRFKQRDLTD